MTIWNLARFLVLVPASLHRLFMDVREYLRQNKKELVQKWVEGVFNTYPLETTGFLRTKHDPFANPVAHMTREAGNILYDAISGEEVDPREVKAALDRFIKLRAVQKFNPGESMAVFYLMKPLMRQTLLPEMRAQGQLDSYLEVESRLDTLVLLAFDMYMHNRETLAESRIKEIRNQHAQLSRWAQNLENGFPGKT